MKINILNLVFLGYVLGKSMKHVQKQDVQVKKAEKEYYFDTSSEYDVNSEDANKLLFLNEQKLKGTKYQVSSQMVQQPKISGHSTEAEQPYYDPTLQSLGEPLSRVDGHNILVVPVKSINPYDKLKEEALKRKNKATRDLLFKNDQKLVNEVYYDGGAESGSLMVEDNLQQRLREKQERNLDKKKTVHLDEFIQSQNNLKLRQDLLLNRLNLYIPELPDYRVQRKNEYRAQLDQTQLQMNY